MQLLIIFIAYQFLFAPVPEFSTIELEVKNLKLKESSEVIYSLYTTTNAFLDEKDVYSYGKVKANNTTTLILKIEAPTHMGKIAIAVFQDLNGNGKLDKNIVGMPKEPYGFSLNFRPTFRGPHFEEAAFLPKDSSKITIDLIL